MRACARHVQGFLCSSVPSTGNDANFELLGGKASQRCDAWIGAASEMRHIVAGLTMSRALKASFWMYLLFWLVWLTACKTFAFISIHFLVEAHTLLRQATKEGGFSNASLDNGRTVAARGELSLGR